MVNGENIYPVRDRQRKSVEKGFTSIFALIPSKNGETGFKIQSSEKISNLAPQLPRLDLLSFEFSLHKITHTELACTN